MPLLRFISAVRGHGPLL